MTVISKIEYKPLPADQYINESVTKTQLYVHHTASSPNPYGVSTWWASTPEKVATAFIIGGKPTGQRWTDGHILQVFNSSKWAWHLGLKAEHLRVAGRNAKSNTYLNQTSIGIEICSWGQLTQTERGFVSYANVIVPDDEVEELVVPYRGFKYYQAYTPAQLDSVHGLLTYLCDKWNIPTQYKCDAMFDVDTRALSGETGIWSHVSVRPDKNDVYPSPSMIQMLKSI